MLLNETTKLCSTNSRTSSGRLGGVDLISDALPFIIAFIVGGVLVFTAIAAAVIVNLFPRRPK
jgi:hypothetical protein